jgi:RNA polymerase sigma factor (sigma-70 family)
VISRRPGIVFESIGEGHMTSMIQECPRPLTGEDVVEHIMARRKAPDAATGWGLCSERQPDSGIEREPSVSIDGLANELSLAEAGGPLFGELVSVSRRVLGDEDLAWDAVQESLLSLWLDGSVPKNVRAWLRGAVIRRSLHLARCRSRRRRREDRVTMERHEPCDRDDPRRSIEVQEFVALIMTAVLAINPEFREVLLLSLDDTMDYASMSQRLGIPIGTVRSRLSRSRGALRAVLLRTLPEDYRLLLPDSNS